MTEISAPSTQPRTFQAFPNFRWLRPSGTTTEPDRLQQAHRCIETGEIDWIDIPVVVDPSAMTDAREIDGFCTDCWKWTHLHGPAGNGRCSCGSGRVVVPPAGFRIISEAEVDQVRDDIQVGINSMTGDCEPYHRIALDHLDRAFRTIGRKP